MPKLSNLSVEFLSLVKKPATGKGLTLKSAKDDQRYEPFSFLKTDDERMVAYGIVYAPDQVDSHGDEADAITIRRAAYDFMRNARLQNIDTEHSFKSEAAFVAESWLVRKGDPLFPDEPEDAWAVGIQIGDPDLWRQLKSGELTGISLAGFAQSEPETNPEPSNHFTQKDQGWLTRFMKNTFNLSPVKETEMDEKQVRDIVRAEVGDALKDALKSAGIVKEDGADNPTDGEGANKNAATADAKSDAPQGGGVDADALAKSVIAALEPKLDGMVAKAVAKGATETESLETPKNEESFA